MTTIIEQLKKTLSPSAKEAIIQMGYQGNYYKNYITYLETRNKELELKLEDAFINF